ncbi:MAG TPA: ElyC/SanA/YdcF family protein [Cellulomonas sp.]
MTDLRAVAEAIGVLAAFCGVRDVPDLRDRRAVEAAAGGRVDVAILFGGSILAGAEVMAAVVQDGLATTSMIVGGEGHTTAALRAHAARVLGDLGAAGADRGAGELADGDLAGPAEAEIFDRYLRERFGVRVDLLERESTNCGSNVARALTALEDAGVAHERVLLIQDATMQRRMAAVWQQQDPGARVLNHAAYVAPVTMVDGRLAYRRTPLGMWPVERFASMLLGEVARLRDDTDGYGPHGRGFLVHVDIPTAVEQAVTVVRSAGLAEVRRADPRWG